MNALELSGEPYITCIECGKQYVTAEELVEADRLMYEELVKVSAEFGLDTAPYVKPKPEEISMCPECSHDF